jgi:poly-gamma-glutamate capsule biosynthesis protein CapA/YwtB (metallophosphatase superfamily)
MTGKTVMMATGDLTLGRSNIASIFDLAAPILKSSDIVIGQLEQPFTKRGTEKYLVEIPTEIWAMPEADPANIPALKAAGFNVVTFATNHIWDSGVPGIEDTLAGLRNCGIAVVGAGMNIGEARKPLIINHDGMRFGLLDYNCVGPKMSWATPDKPGCAYIHVVVAYELEHPTPGGNPTIYTFAEPRSLQWMVDDIRNLRPLCDVLVVTLHKGLGMTPIKLAMYEQQISHAAVDAGADLILAHHSHILHGIEIYKCATIFHGLGNFALIQPFHPQTWNYEEFQRKAVGQLGVDFTDNSPYPFAPEARNTIIAKCVIDGKKISRISYLPCLINEQQQPEVLKNDTRGQQVFDYVEKITRGAGLNARYKWDGDEVLIYGD